MTWHYLQLSLETKFSQEHYNFIDDTPLDYF